MKINKTVIIVLTLVVISGVFLLIRKSIGGNNSQSNQNIIQTDGIATIKLSSLQNGNYVPKVVEVKLGTKVRIEADTATITGSMGEIIIDGYDVSKEIKPGDNILEFVADKPGQFRMHCANNMGNGTLIVK